MLSSCVRISQTEVELGAAQAAILFGSAPPTPLDNEDDAAALCIGGAMGRGRGFKDRWAPVVARWPKLQCGAIPLLAYDLCSATRLPLKPGPKMCSASASRVSEL